MVKKFFDMSTYWKKRFSMIGINDLRGVGNQLITKKDNQKAYDEAKKVLLKQLQLFNTDFKNIKVLDIGCGNGFHAKMFEELGVKNYTGIDITDAYFCALKTRHPNYTFKKMDARKEQITDKYDLIIVIDVLQHMIKNEDYYNVLMNAEQSLNKQGIFVFTHYWCYTFNGYHVFNRTIDSIIRIFKNYSFAESVLYRDKCLGICKRMIK